MAVVRQPLARLEGLGRTPPWRRAATRPGPGRPYGRFNGAVTAPSARSSPRSFASRSLPLSRPVRRADVPGFGERYPAAGRSPTASSTHPRTRPDVTRRARTCPPFPGSTHTPALQPAKPPQRSGCRATCPARPVGSRGTVDRGEPGSQGIPLLAGLAHFGRRREVPSHRALARCVSHLCRVLLQRCLRLAARDRMLTLIYRAGTGWGSA